MVPSPGTLKSILSTGTAGTQGWGIVQWPSVRGEFAPHRDIGNAADMFGCHTLERVEARDSAKDPTNHRTPPPTKNYLARNV